MSWPTGQAEVKELLAARHLQQVPASLDDAQALLTAAGKHLTSALTLADSDPDSAYTLLYDAARKSLAAVLQAQGLRATSDGGHYAIQIAIGAQFTAPPPRDAFRPFVRLRRTRNQSEYEPVSPLTSDDVRVDHALAVRLHQTAAALVPNLPVFTV